MEKVRFSCGHLAEKKWPSPEIDNEDPDFYQREGLCPECFKKKNHIDPEYARQFNVDCGLPVLTSGTIKQKNYAEILRYKALQLNYIIQKEDLQMRDVFQEELKKETSANFWINNKSIIFRGQEWVTHFLAIQFLDSKTSENKNA
jgi:hypothetical protein